MSRVGLRQSDMFAAAAPPAVTEVDPTADLRALLERLRAAELLPWPDAAGAMAEERRALGLAGAEGERLVAAILDETERLLGAAD